MSPAQKHTRAYGPWIVHCDIGHGGQGSVFRVQHQKTRVMGALKLLRRTDTKAMERFRREVEAAKSLGSEVAVPVIDQGISDFQERQPWYVMPLAKYPSLQEQGVYVHGDMERCLRLSRKILHLVATTHAHGIVHRDLKPGNILFPTDPNEPRLADFGICYLISDLVARLTETSERVGSRGFVAPEQDLGRNVEVDAKADVFSAGKLIHWMYTGMVTEGNRLVSPDEIERSTGDTRYRELWRFLTTRLVVEDRSSRAASLDDVLGEYDELAKRILGVSVPPRVVDYRAVPDTPPGEDPSRWRQAKLLRARVPQSAVDAMRAALKLGGGKAENINARDVGNSLGVPPDVALARLAEPRDCNLVEIIVPLVKEPDQGNYVVRLSALGVTFLRQLGS